MNEFYSISETNTKAIDKFQLENLGLERVTSVMSCLFCLLNLYY